MEDWVSPYVVSRRNWSEPSTNLYVLDLRKGLDDFVLDLNRSKAQTIQTYKFKVFVTQSGVLNIVVENVENIVEILTT